MLEGRRILCAVDGSRPAEQALIHGIALARATGSDLEVLYVEPHTPMGSPRPVGTAQELRSLEEAKRHLDELARRHNLEARVPVEVRVVAGAPDGGIVVAAGTHHADLVVMGGDARSALARFVGGSVSDSVVHRLDRPVLVVPDVPAQVPCLPPVARSARVVVPVSFTPSGGAALAAAVSLARELPSHLHLVHVLRRPLFGPAPSLSERAQARSDLELAAHRAGVVGAFSVHVPEGSVAERVRALAERVGADLLVVPMKRRKGLSRVLGGVPERLLRGTKVPVLCVPAPEAASARFFAPLERSAAPAGASGAPRP